MTPSDRQIIEHLLEQVNRLHARLDAAGLPMVDVANAAELPSAEPEPQLLEVKRFELPPLDQLDPQQERIRKIQLEVLEQNAKRLKKRPLKIGKYVHNQQSSANR